MSGGIPTGIRRIHAGDRAERPLPGRQATYAELDRWKASIHGKDRVVKIVSGGQSGVDRAALDVALVLGIPCGGWCPRDRYAEDGPIEDRYPLKETPSGETAQRTEWNVRDSDGTLVLTRGEPTGGTALTIRCARNLGRPIRVVDLVEPCDPEKVRLWIRRNRINVLNVAGPRESKCPGIYGEASMFLRTVLGDRGAKGRDAASKGRGPGR